MTSGWCAGAKAADNPTVGEVVPAADACDCTAGTVTCKVGLETALVSSGSYSGVTLSTVNTNAINNTQGGITFNSKYGGINLGSLPANPIITLSAGGDRYSTQISVSQLGQVNVCRPSTSGFISGYPSC
jgi:hypothetical protein